MTHFWILISFSWLNTVSLQHIQSDGLGVGSADQIQEYSMPYMSFLDVPIQNKFDHSREIQNSNEYNQFYQRDDVELQDNVRRRRSDNIGRRETNEQLPNLDHDKTFYLSNSEKSPASPFALQVQTDRQNDTDFIYGPIQKRSFSPWGGKRNEPNIENMWSWKRTANIREPSMPKRVRFSPWGGKRSDSQPKSQESKGSKIIFSSYVPELTSIASKNALPVSDRMNVAGFQYISPLDKRHPIRVLALGENTFDRTIKAPPLSYNSYIDSTEPHLYKPGHPYIVLNLKKDGKRKVKFSTWGGKRASPLIGPIWSPFPQGLTDSTLKAILLVRKNAGLEKKPMVAL